MYIWTINCNYEKFQIQAKSIVEAAQKAVKIVDRKKSEYSGVLTIEGISKVGKLEK